MLHSKRGEERGREGGEGGRGEERKGKNRKRAEDNLSGPTARRNAIDYDLWRGVAGRAVSVPLVIRKI